MLTTKEEILDIKIGDRLVSLVGRVSRVYKSRDEKHMFLDLETAEGDIVKIKAFGDTKDNLKGLAEEGKVLSFEALRADEIKFKGNTPFDFELNFLKHSEVKEVEEEEAECEYDISRMDPGKKYILEFYVQGKLRDIGGGMVGGKAVDKVGNRTELHIKGSLKNLEKKFSKEAAAYKVAATAVAQGSKGIHLVIQDPSLITDCVPWTDPLPRKTKVPSTISDVSDPKSLKTEK